MVSIRKYCKKILIQCVLNLETIAGQLFISQKSLINFGYIPSTFFYKDRKSFAIDDKSIISIKDYFRVV